jgi:hypothetical protein
VLETFWWLLLIACLVWYTVLTVYVGIRGAWDIQAMLQRLKNINDEAPAESELRP